MNDQQLETRILGGLAKGRDDAGVEDFDLQAIAGEGLRKICIQSPYVSKVAFDKLVGEAAPEFSETGDDVYVWWFFFVDREKFHLEVPRVDVMDQDAAGKVSCINTPPAHVIFSRTDGTTRYVLEGR